MRFSSNEGQNTEPDVILILIKEGRLESILLNTINPFFLFEGNKGLQGRGYGLSGPPLGPAIFVFCVEVDDQRSNNQLDLRDFGPVEAPGWNGETVSALKHAEKTVSFCLRKSFHPLVTGQKTTD